MDKAVSVKERGKKMASKVGWKPHRVTGGDAGVTEARNGSSAPERWSRPRDKGTTGPGGRLLNDSGLGI